MNVEDNDLITPADVRRVLDAAWGGRVRAESGWNDEGDYTRLAAAFDELESVGILARMNFTCCQTCGHAEIDEERMTDRQYRGYVFFHAQDAERLGPGRSELFLAYGAFGPDMGLDADLLRRAEQGDAEARQAVVVGSEESVAREIVQGLRGHELLVEWNGTCAQRIRLPEVDWRKRLPSI